MAAARRSAACASPTMTAYPIRMCCQQAIDGWVEGYGSPADQIYWIIWEVTASTIETQTMRDYRHTRIVVSSLGRRLIYFVVTEVTASHTKVRRSRRFFYSAHSIVFFNLSRIKGLFSPPRR